ncbi:hypothetical protein [Candidatus Leptofilum sp.]|uniref:hypothetical protein n=1 Tax=Candidatus Leptofilum sp. TaxID=3241576 RepID=UPI003B5BDF3D
MTNQNPDLDQLSAAELRRRLIVAQEENKVLTEAFQTLTFDLRAQLSVIAGAAHLLLEKEQELFPPLDQEQAEIAEMAANGANRANEIIYKTLEMVENAKGVENLGASFLLNYRRELQEANQQLERLNVKYQATQDVLQNFRHEILEAVNRMMGSSRLFLEQPELMGGPLNREQLEGIEIIWQSAEHNYEIIKHYFFDLLRAIEVVDEEPEPEAATLAEIVAGTEFVVESELALETAVSINRYEAQSIINLLARGWFQRNKGSVLEVTAVSDDTLRFHFPHTAQIRNNIEDILDDETGQLKFTERQRYFDPVGLATGLVEKYSGAVYVELTGDSTGHLSFTLPIYHEES